MIHITKNEISKLDYVNRINLVNSVSGYKSANLIGSISEQGIENLAVFSSVVHLGSNPAVLGFILRPTTVPRDTYKNIKETQYYTINHIVKKITKKAHKTSIKYPENVSEFKATGLIPIYKNGFKAPFLDESPVQIAMKYVEEYHIKINDVIMIVGEIQGIYIDDIMLQDDGFVSLSKGNVATINGLDAYCIPELFERYEYQKL